MASSSGASSSTAGNPKTSRFSTLKMFKLNGRDKPPPPPPKDPYYLPNRSMTSLSPDSLSIPPQSPISPHYLSQYPHRQSPAPSQSTMSLVSSAASQISAAPTDQVAPKKKKSLNFLKFTKRSKSFTKGAEEDGREMQGDQGITWPANFAHNIHVDDGLTGLPPSWAKSLAERGYTDEEIAHFIANKRTANMRIQQLYSGRPESPASSHMPLGAQSQSPPSERTGSPSQDPSASPVLTHPMPRSTSLTRKYSNASIHGRSPHPPPTNVPVPPLVTSPSSTSLHSIRTTGSSNSSRHHTPSRLNAAPGYHNPAMSTDSHISYQTAPNVPPPVPAVPATPTRRMQLANPNTPPPAYSAPRNPIIAVPPDGKSTSPLANPTGVVASDTMTAPVLPPSLHRSQPSVESTSSSQGNASAGSSSTQSTPQLQRQRSEGLSQPPRLSLHASNGSDDWTKLVLSAGSLGTEGAEKPTAPAKPPPPTRPIPPIIVPDEDEDREAPPTGWAEASSTARYPLSSSSSSPPNSNSPSWHEFKSEMEDFVSKGDFQEAPLSAALTESFSPTIPDSIARSRQRDTLRPGPDGTLLVPPQDKYSRAEGDEDEDDDDFLSVRRSNRDSSRSSTSTLSTNTVTAYTYSTSQVVRKASVVRRAGAYVTTLPVSSPNKEKPSPEQSLSTRKSLVQMQVVAESSSPVENQPLSPTGDSFPAQNRDSGSSSGSRRLSGAPPSPMNSQFGSDESAGSAITTGSSATTSSQISQDQHPTPTTDPGSVGLSAGLVGDRSTVELDLVSYYTNTPSPSRSTFAAGDLNLNQKQCPPPSPRDTFGYDNRSPGSGGVVKVVSGDVDVGADDPPVEFGKDDEDEDDREGDDDRGTDEEEEDDEGTWDTLRGNAAVAAVTAVTQASATRPVIIVSGDSTPSLTEQSRPPSSAGGGGASSSMPTTPLSPVQRYPGWLSGVVRPLSPFIDEAVEPREHYFELQEIAEGESGSIFAARINPSNASKLRLHPKVKNRDLTELKKGAPVLVAVKIIAISPPSSSLPSISSSSSSPPISSSSPPSLSPSSSPISAPAEGGASAQLPEAQKLIDLERELKLMKGLWHENILGLDALYVDLTEDTLWVRMELMERSLADIVGLVVDGLMLQDRMIARFAQDVLHALEYLQQNRIAHRDVRSDNLLLNSHGVLKLTDFSNAVRLPPESSLRSDPAGVIFWQAPEMRYPNYDALKVDVWSLGATIWEMAETEPPFSDTKQVQSRWPPLTRPEIWSPAFHSFLRACSDSATARKSPTELLKDPFVSNVCGRGVIVQLLQQCMNIERMIQGANDS